jgi:hypothetical protein
MGEVDAQGTPAQIRSALLSITDLRGRALSVFVYHNRTALVILFNIFGSTRRAERSESERLLPACHFFRVMSSSFILT